MKDVRVEASSPQTRTSSTSKLLFFHIFLSLWVIFYPPGAGNRRPRSMQILADLDPGLDPHNTGLSLEDGTF